MNSTDSGLVGKRVKDMHGASIGEVVGTITDIDGTIQTVGVDRGSSGLDEIPYSQLVVQPDVVIYIPKWRLDSQRLLREKELALRRVNALMSIVKENDGMREDAEIVHAKYKAKLESLDALQDEIRTKLEARLGELDEQMKSVKTLVFDARVQSKSGEIDNEAFESVKTHTGRLVEQITHEHNEITSMQKRITDLSMKVQDALECTGEDLQESAVSYLDDAPGLAAKLPQAPQEQVTHEPQHERMPESPVPAAMAGAREPTPPQAQPQPPPQPQPRMQDRTTWFSHAEPQ